MNVCLALQAKLQAALTGLCDNPAEYASLVKPVPDPRHGDYQANCAMPLGKVLSKPPREIAQEIIQRLGTDEMFGPPEVAGPGFINFRLKPQWLAQQMQLLGADERLGVEKAAKPRTIIVDYSSPNVAKPLHVGHLRSTIIGDAITRLLRFLGHNVITDNHLGDWGTQFGILLYGYKNFLDREAYKADPVHELARLYVEVRSRFSSDDEDEGDDPVKQACRLETAKLHAGDPENLALWREFMPHCLEEVNAIYRRLGILTFDHVHGESFYNPMLPGVVEDMLARNLAVESNGAVIIPNAKGIIPTQEQIENGEEPPGLIRKRDGAFTYTTSDLATVKYRAETFQPDLVLYVVDFRQGLHFKTFFAQAKRWGYDKMELEHISYGTIMGKPDKPGGKPRPISTRAGGGALLEELLDLAVAAAREILQGGDMTDISEGEIRKISEVVGIGAVKYADLSQNRTSDYVFDVQKMTATTGNTATYMQYAYARNRSIFRKGEVNPELLRCAPPAVSLDAPQERALAVQLLRFSEVLEQAAMDYRPNIITGYLWDLSSTYSSFFENCPVLKAPSDDLRQSRLLLCDVTARIIQHGLSLLGIETIERM